MKVSLQFTKPSGWFIPLSWAIQKIERTRYSHVRIKFELQGVPLILEASGRSVKLIGLAGYHQATNHTVVSEYEATLDEYEQQRLIELLSMAGIRYGLLQLVGIGIQRLCGLRHNPLSRGTNAVVCSELAGIFLECVMGLDVREDLDLVGPAGIEELTRNSSRFKLPKTRLKIVSV